MSEHALQRMYGRSLCLEAVCRALRFGRVTFARGAAHFVLGKKEVKRYEPVRPGDNGLQLVASSIEEGTVLTLYHNRGFTATGKPSPRLEGRPFGRAEKGHAYRRPRP